MDDSSTTTTSCLSRLARSCLNRVVLSGRQPSSRCRVTPCGRPSRSTASGTPCRPRQLVGSRPPAAGSPPCRSGRLSATDSRSPRAAAWSASSASIRATVVVLPVPGPPVTIVVHLRTADSAAAICSSLACSPRTLAIAAAQPRLVDHGRRLLRRGRRGRHVPASRGGGSGRGRARRRIGPNAARPSSTRVERRTASAHAAASGHGSSGASARDRRRARGRPTHGGRRAPPAPRPAARARRPRRRAPRRVRRRGGRRR